MKIFKLVIIFLSTPLIALAYIMPTRTILQKTSENAGSGIYAIEQEVQFPNGDDFLTLKESWLIENERTMRLTVTGGKELNNTFKLQFIYVGGQKWSVTNKSRNSENISADFLEKFLNFRSPENFAHNLTQQKIIPENAFQKKFPTKVNREYRYNPESWVRYSRTGGVVNYALGIPTSVDDEANQPGIWIEQDQFVIRKVRLPSQVEFSANDYNEFAKGLSYPRTRTIRWGQNMVTIRLISANAKSQVSNNAFQPGSLEASLNWDGIEKLPAKDAITEFYTRFR